MRIELRLQNRIESNDKTIINSITAKKKNNNLFSICSASRGGARSDKHHRTTLASLSCSMNGASVLSGEWSIEVEQNIKKKHIKNNSCCWRNNSHNNKKENEQATVVECTDCRSPATQSAHFFLCFMH